jgi:hypothetical protein
MDCPTKIILSLDSAGYPTVRIEADGEVSTFDVDENAMEDVARLCHLRECVWIKWDKSL